MESSAPAQHRAGLARGLGLDPLPVGGERTIEQGLLDPMLALETGTQAGMELLVDPGNTEEDRGTRFLDVFEDPSHVRAEPDLSGHIGAQIVGGKTLGDVGEGEIGHHPGAKVDVGRTAQALSRPNDVAMTDHYTLGSARGPRGVDEGGQ